MTLTLPGFAGMILTIGVAADANIVIFERIKEESRAGKSVRAAIAAGYAKGFWTIIDANVVTAITALVLFSLATAGVKGFALMLLIGTAISMITAVFATRAMLGLLAGFRWFDSPAFMGATGAQDPELDPQRLRRQAKDLVRDLGRDHGALDRVAPVQGLNLGIDFEGGTRDHDPDAAAGRARGRSRAGGRDRAGRRVVQGAAPRSATVSTASSRCARPRSNPKSSRR